jgi:hypothetical protein
VTLPMPFPTKEIAGDYNPAIRLFGLRFVADQTIVEYLSEFLSIVFSNKTIWDDTITTPLPSLEDLQKWSATSEYAPLRYAPPIRLNLKLLAFYGLTPLAKRHKVHGYGYERVATMLESQIKSSTVEPEEARRCIEDFFKGFQGAGDTRTWCARTFYPISESLLTQETMWEETKARKDDLSTWEDSIDNFSRYYSTTKHNFLARGGELLYLQLCNALSTEQRSIDDFVGNAGPFFDEDEVQLKTLHNSLQNGLKRLYGSYTAPLDELADYVERLDKETYKRIGNYSKALTCEWCPRDSWPEGYLFAVELNRLMSTTVSLADKLELMMIGCALQVLRSLCAQSARYMSPLDKAKKGRGGALGYAWIFSAPDSCTRQQSLVSQRNLQAIEALIQGVLRISALETYVREGQKDDRKIRERYKEADKKYGYKLFRSLGKNLLIIIPRRGSGARFVMTEKVLRYMVMTLVRPGERLTYDEFLERLYCFYGIAVESPQLMDAMVWSGLPANQSVQSDRESWLCQMLRAGGFLTELSDARSIVCNPFGTNID